MKQQDYKAIAKIISNNLQTRPSGFRILPAAETMDHLADYFAKDPKFNRSAFWKACGL